MKVKVQDPQFFNFIDESTGLANLCLIQVGNAPDAQNGLGNVIVGEKLEMGEMINHLLPHFRGSVMQKSNENLVEELVILNNIYQDIGLFLKDPLKVLSPAALKQVYVPFAVSADKERVVDALEKFVSESQVQNVGDTVRSIFEELFMNALIDAPRESVKRGWGLEYIGTSSRLFGMAYSEDEFVFTCFDPYGSLDSSLLLKRLKVVYEQGAGQAINYGSGGAGLGCFILLENCAQVFAVVKEKVGTVFACKIARWSSRRDRITNPKSLHIVSES
jgi:hypothetical protein